ncbi:MAG: ATP-dependent DNA helicase RecG, partial [Bacteroidota bacterium]
MEEKKPLHVLDSPIEYLKGVGPQRGDLLRKELGIYTLRDLIMQFPFRYVDKTRFHRIRELQEEGSTVQVRGVLRRLDMQGEGRKRRLVGRLRDNTGMLELVWFKGAQYLQKQLVIGQEYVAYGKISMFRQQPSMAHPELELVNLQNTQQASTFAPVYPSTEKLNNKGLDAKARRRLMKTVLDSISPDYFPENLPDYIIQKFKLPAHDEAIRNIHFPKTQKQLKDAINRLKFEELFFLQLRLLENKRKRKDAIKGFVFGTIGNYFNTFFHTKLPFELTGAQKRVLKEIRIDLGKGVQMNRLLQGDVGSGKTMVGLMTMLMALDNGYQACMMAPTEILAQQHYDAVREYVEGLEVNVAFLSGSVKGKKRKQVLADLAAGNIHILLGTHALIEDPVIFNNLGLAIIDEQHRFGVKQRAKLWRKSQPYPPHVLVMTATPIPRTLAMTLYGDLDVSVIDELPPGRKPVQTVHRNENHRMRVFGFMRDEIKKGRQCYVVYPLIEES